MTTPAAAIPVTKTFQGMLQEGPVGANEVIHLITTDTVDRDGEVVIPSGIDLSNYRKNPVVMFGHAQGKPTERYPFPVAKNLWIKPSSDNRGLVAKTAFDTDAEDGQTVCGKVKRGVLGTYSITFIPKRFGPPTRQEIAARPDWATAKTIYREVELVEYSVVAIPANPEVVTIQKSAVSFAVGPVVDVPYDSAAACERVMEWATADGVCDWRKYGEAFAWYDATQPEDASSYRLPHHDVEGGQLVVNRKAVESVAQQLNASRRYYDPSRDTFVTPDALVPAADLDRTMTHIAGHFRQWDEKPPWEYESKTLAGGTVSKAVKKDEDDGVPEAGDEGESDAAAGEEPIRRGMFVKIMSGDCKGCGQVISVHKDGDFVPDVGEHVIGNAEEPAARVHRYKKSGDGFEPTGHYSAHKCKCLEKCDALKPPSKKKSFQPPAAAAQTPPATPAPAEEPPKPLRCYTPQEVRQKALALVTSPAFAGQADKSITETVRRLRGKLG